MYFTVRLNCGVGMVEQAEDKFPLARAQNPLVLHQRFRK